MKIPPVEDQYRMDNVSDKGFRGNKNAHFMLNNAFKNCVIYEIMWKNVVQQGNHK
jgi:hypothetical protein